MTSFKRALSENPSECFKINRHKLVLQFGFQAEQQLHAVDVGAQCLLDLTALIMCLMSQGPCFKSRDISLTICVITVICLNG